MTEDKFFEIQETLAKLIKNTVFENKVYIVGGSVRDLFMNREINDIDIVVNIQGGGLKLANHLNNLGMLLHDPVEYPQYSVSMFVLKQFPDVEIEAVQTRKEHYFDSNSRNPETAFGSIEEDCIRRDLTINALYINVSTNEVLDITGGLDDIDNHVIRVTNSNPDVVFVDDPLRILRVVRFASRFGWNIQDATYESMKKNVDRLSIISVERINDEFSKMITCANPKLALNMLREIGAIKYIIPELESLYECGQNEFHGFDTVWEHTVDFVQSLRTDDLTVRLAGLLHDIGKPITKTESNGKIHFYNHESAGLPIINSALKRLHYSNDIISNVCFFVKNHMKFFCFSISNPNDAVIRRVQFDCKTLERYIKLMMLMEGDRLSVPDKYKETNFFDEIMKHTELMILKNEDMFGYELPVDGNDIMQIKGISGGPDIKRIKNSLLKHAMKRNDKISREEAIKFIKGFNLDA